MRNKMTIAIVAGVAATTFGLAAGGNVSAANNGNDKDVGKACVQLGQLHKTLEIGKPGVAAHNPGSHTGRSGLCD